MRLTTLTAIFGVFLLAGCATTNGERIASPEDPFAMPIDEFMQETDILRASLAQGEPRELEDEELKRFDEIGERITALVGDATEIEQIAMNDREQLFELRSQMVKLVVGDVEPTLVCFNQHTTGTRLKGTRRCYTLEELERNRFDAQELMRYIQSQPRGRHPDSG